ncbi:BTB/POZ domain-containing protein 6-like [Mytilus galloprovincialis]|uniref:BTB/POZ domain-containing protein 3/6 n=1 Tax=Mytilus galloprovincialis TaxID=29158 RepID=A0A8B6EHM1_MYTGA|nr:BTB/POZ domain-containing protein 3/6 [Mytilus galloprovincialis]
MASSEEDWQSSRCLVECNRYMLENNIGCDVTFLVGEDKTKVLAHKHILISRSCVFFAMFNGPLAEKGQEIALPDIEHSVFRILLQYLYCEDTDIKPDLVLQLLYAAKKYSIQSLVKVCVKYLELDRSAENICTIFEQSYIFDEQDLQEKCLAYIRIHAPDVLHSNDFLELSPHCLELVLQDDLLRVDEQTILSCVLKWASNKCTKKEKEVSSENQRAELGHLLYLIRFPLMGKEYFTDVISEMDILSDKEKVELFKFFYQKGSKITTFITHERSEKIDELEARDSEDTRPIQTCIRYHSVYEDGSWYCGGEPDAVAFTTNRPIILHGVLVYGSYIGEGVYDITCSLYDTVDHEVATRRTRLKTSESQHTYPVLLEHPVTITNSKKHTVVVKLTNAEGLDTYQGKGGTTSVNCGTVRFSFSKSKYSRNGTDTKIGQIPGLLFTCGEDEDSDV